MKNLAKNVIRTVALISVIVLLTTNVTFAEKFDPGYKVLAPLPGTCTNDSSGNCAVKTGTPGALSGYINGLYRIVVAGASVLAVLMIIVGGFNYVASDAINNKEEGKSMIKGALGGLLLVFASYIVLNTVNPQLLSLKVGDTQLKAESLMSLLSTLNNQAQQQFNFLTDQANAQLADTKVNKEQLKLAINQYRKTIDGDPESSDPNTKIGLRGVYEKYYNVPELSDEQKIALFGTADQTVIDAQKKEIESKIEATEGLIAKATQQAEQIGSFTKVTGSIKNIEASLVRGDIKDFPLAAQVLNNNLKTESAEMMERNSKMNVLDPQGAQERNDRLTKDLANLRAQTNAGIKKVCDKIPPLISVTGVGFGGQVGTTATVPDRVQIEACQKFLLPG